MSQNTQNFNNLTPGIYQDLPASVYHSLPFTNNSYLKRLDRCPAAAKVEDHEETKALLFGRAAHVLTLEGYDAFNAECILQPEGAPKRPTQRQIDAKKPSPETLYAIDWWEKFNLQADGKVILSADDYEKLVGVRESVHSHPFAKALLAEGVSETTCIFDTPIAGQMIRCKVRPDRRPSPEMQVLLDLKTCEDASPEAFLRQSLRLGYIQQAAFYIDGYNRSRNLIMKKGEDGTYRLDTSVPPCPPVTAFAFIAVEKKAPYRCEVYTVDNDLLMWGRGQYERLLRLEIDCRNANHWPNYTNAGAEDLVKPAWL